MRLFLLISFFLAASVNAEPLKKFDLNPDEVKAIQEHHQSLNILSPLRTSPAPSRPFSEVEEAGYLFFSASTYFDSAVAKRTMAQHLPPGVTLVIYTAPGANKDTIRDQYRDVVDVSRVKIVEIDNSSRGFWSRDGLPVPVWSPEGKMEVVDARYYHRFEPDDLIGQWFGTTVRKHTYYYEGGNFMVNDKGVCVMVDNDRAVSIPDSIFSQQYGCKKLVRLPFEKGIGHVDESVRFLTSDIVLTDSQDYADRLRKEGLDVRLLPRPRYYYETYVNALLLNGTVFVPVFNQSRDEQALDVYRATGLKVVPIETQSLSNDGNGSIHCITMTYPKVPFQQLMKFIGGRELN